MDMTHANFHFKRLMLTSIFGIRAFEPGGQPVSFEQLAVFYPQGLCKLN